jgi:iron complex transport system substrate-binding protein
MKRYWMLLAAVAWVVLGSAAHAETTVTIVDSTERAVELTLPVERVVTAYAMATFYLYALGAGDLLVGAWYIGVPTLGAAPEVLHRLEPDLAAKHFGGQPNLEEVVARSPDWILVDASRHAQFADLAEEVGLAVTRLAVETPDAVVDVVHRLAPALGADAESRADDLGETYRVALDAARRATEGVEEPPRVLFLGSTPQLVASGEMYQTHLIAAAGGRSVAADLVGYWAEVSVEQIYAWDPQVVILPSYAAFAPEDLLTDPEWAPISAVRESRVYRMERLFAPWDTPVPDSFLGILWLAECLHPGRVPIDLRDEVRRFYAAYYDYEVSESELDRLCGL